MKLEEYVPLVEALLPAVLMAGRIEVTSEPGCGSVFAFDDGTWFYPGHGNDSTLGSEPPHLTERRQRGW